MNGDDFYDKWHEDGDTAFGILQDGCTFPPSAEVFEHELEARRKRTRYPISVVNHARHIADTYSCAAES